MVTKQSWTQDSIHFEYRIEKSWNLVVTFSLSNERIQFGAFIYRLFVFCIH